MAAQRLFCGARQSYTLILILLHSSLLAEHCCLGFASPKAPVIAIIGGDLAGVTAALTIAEQHRGCECSVRLLTGHPHVLKGMFDTDIYPILPDVTLDNRQLIDRYGNGGRELAGLLAKQCSPLQAKEWLETQGVLMREEGEAGSSDDTLTLLGESPLFLSPTCHLRNVLEQTMADKKNIQIEINTVITDILPENSGFLIGSEGSNQLHADLVILASDYQDGTQAPILVEQLQVDKNKPGAAKKNELMSFDFDDEEPLSLKDQMLLQKKKQKNLKMQKINSISSDNDVEFKELSRQDQKVLARKRTKEKKTKTKTLKQQRNGIEKHDSDAGSYSTAVDEQHQTEYDSPEVAEEAPIAPSLSSTTLDTLGLATKLGHTIVDASPGMFDFLVPARCFLEGCAKAIVPKARLRCKVELPSGTSKKKNTKPVRLPKLEGPLVVADGEVSGPSALRLSTMIAHEMAGSGYRGTLQLHFAPDIGGVEELTTMLLDTVDPNASVLESPCPLVHREIDYDDYDVETGNFKTVEFPLVPDTIWANFCQQAGIKIPTLKWKDVSPSSAQNLARLLVDCSLPITGVRPQENILAGGVSLKEIEMARCKSRMMDGLFFCGSIIDVHGFDRGFNPLVSLATGRVAGMNAIESLDIH